MCSPGATGILCGACEPKYTYNKVVNACVACTSTKHFGIYTVLGLLFIVVIASMYKLKRVKDNKIIHGLNDWINMMFNIDVAKAKVRSLLLFSILDSDNHNFS